MYSKVKWITVDAGGTLLFPDPSVGTIYSEILRIHGQTETPEALEEAFLKVWREDSRRCLANITPESERQRWRGIIDKTFEKFLPSVDADLLFEDLWDAFIEPHRWRVAENAVTALRELRNHGYKTAILSNWDERLRPLLSGMNLDHLFNHFFVSCEVGFEKPDRRIFQFVEKQLHASGNEILHIGDSHHHDILPAQELGWQTLHAFPKDSDTTSGDPLTDFAKLPRLLHDRSEIHL